LRRRAGRAAQRGQGLRQRRPSPQPAALPFLESFLDSLLPLGGFLPPRLPFFPPPEPDSDSESELPLSLLGVPLLLLLPLGEALPLEGAPSGCCCCCCSGCCCCCSGCRAAAPSGCCCSAATCCCFSFCCCCCSFCCWIWCT
jgi:hypothetical protein